MDERPNKEAGKLRSNFACGYDRAEAPPKVRWDKYSISERETPEIEYCKKKKGENVCFYVSSQRREGLTHQLRML